MRKARLGDGQRRCANCYYVIDGLAEHVCPECGRAFNPHSRASYVQLPKFDRVTFWQPLVVTLLVLGWAGLIILVLSGNFGIALSIFLPVGLGISLGYAFRGKAIGRALLGLLAVTVVGTSLMFMDPAGAICGVIIFVIILVPVAIGIAVGTSLRHRLKEDLSFTMRDYLPMALLLALPFLYGVTEQRGFSPQTDVVRTERAIPIAPDRVWESLVFFEETRGPVPPVLDWLLPTPRMVKGERNAVDDETICVYDNGELVKRVTEIEYAKLLRFDVIEQDVGLDRVVHLEGGAFSLKADGAGGTILVLETEYRSAMYPRIVWSWSERASVRALHQHVSDEIERMAETRTRDPIAHR